MQQSFSTQIIARVALWAFVFLAEILNLYVVKEWGEYFGNFSINIATVFLIFIASFRFGEYKTALIFRDLCLYDVFVQCIGWWMYVSGFEMNIYFSLTYTVLALKFIFLLWPTQTINGNASIDWPAIGFFSFRGSIKKYEISKEKCKNTIKERKFIYLIILLSFPIIHIYRAFGGKTPLAFWALIGVGIMLVYFLPFISNLEKREALFLDNERKAAALAITKAKNAELEAKNIELANANAAIQALLKEREQAHATLEKYNVALRGAAHDLQHPMFVVRDYAERLMQMPTEPQPSPTHYHQACHALREAMDQMTELINETIQSAQVATGLIKPKLVAIDMNQLAKRFQGNWLEAANRKGLDRFDVYPPWYQGIHCASDMTMLKRILRNLLANAIMHCEQGGGILLALRKKGGQCWVQVWDKGPGIAEGAGKDGAANFAAFAKRVRQQTSSSTGAGFGLGMNNVMQLCTALGCEMHLHAKIGRGSVFSFALPLAPPALIAHTEQQLLKDRAEMAAFHHFHDARLDLPMP